MKFVKGNLRIQRFLGTSENAVKSQLWIAVSVYVLVAILRNRHAIDTPLHTMLQILSVMPFEQVHLYEALTMHEADPRTQAGAAQLPLFATYPKPRSRLRTGRLATAQQPPKLRPHSLGNAPNPRPANPASSAPAMRGRATDSLQSPHAQAAGKTV